LSRPAGWASVTGNVYRETVYFNTSEKNYYEAVRDYVSHCDKATKLKGAHVPAASFLPLWCSWYAYRGDIDQDKMIATARAARELGIGTILIDAGWGRAEETDDPDLPLGRIVYRKEKFPDFREMVKQIQEMGLKVVAWTAPMYWSGLDKTLAMKHKAIDKNGKPLKYRCPRMAETGEISGALLADAIERYNLDGVKIDFMDLGPAPCFSTEHEHDVDDFGEGMDRGFRALHEKITAVNPEAIIEFRMNYTNLNNRQYGNCFRADDAPYDPDQIRRNMAMIKRWSGPIPPHADYAYWPPDETFENKCRFVASICYGMVPTFSMDLTALPNDEKKLIKAWLQFYQEHKKTLTLGEFTPMSFDQHFSVSKIVGEKECFVGLFSPTAPGQIDLMDEMDKTIFLINATGKDRISTVLKGLEGERTVTVYDEFHEEVDAGTLSGKAGESPIDVRVPVGGIVEFKAL